jgi:hypothetical protein
VTELDVNGYHYFGEVEPVETDYGYDVRVRTDGCIKLAKGKLVTEGWYMGGEHEGHHYEFDIGELVNVTQEASIGDGVRLYRMDELDEKQGLTMFPVTCRHDRDVSNDAINGTYYPRPFSVECEKLLAMVDKDDLDEMGERAKGEVRKKVSQLITWALQGGADRVWKVIRTPETVFNGAIPPDRVTALAVQEIVLLGVK